jgi:hypothetical protein
MVSGSSVTRSIEKVRLESDNFIVFVPDFPDFLLRVRRHGRTRLSPESTKPPERNKAAHEQIFELKMDDVRAGEDHRGGHSP